ncbi:TniQ family protein [Hydrogenophaga sp. UC242_50]
MATDNGLRGLPSVKSGLGRSRFHTLDASDAMRLSRWFGAPQADLAEALGRISRSAAEEGFSYAGREIGRSYFLNRGRPRVCPHCLVQHGYCRSAWDFVLVAACPQHVCALEDRCPVCARALDWNRPSLMVCQCWSDLRSWRPAAVDLHSLELAFARWVAVAVAPASIDQDRGSAVEAGQFGLLRLLRPLSLGAGLSLTYALASTAEYSLGMTGQRVRKKTSLLHARQVLQAADELVRRISEGQPIALRVSRRSVTLALLYEAMRRAKCPEDGSIALSLLSHILRQGGRTKWTGRYGQLSQMSLF